MMEILILVCALGVAAPDCQRETSIHSFHAPEVRAGMSGCLREGLLFAAQSELVQPGTYPKVVCISAGRLEEARAALDDGVKAD
jgi:hypothetical protein